MWLSRPVYEGLPFAAMAVGLACVVAAFYVAESHLALILGGAGLAALIAGLVLWLKRRDYRSSRSRKPFATADWADRPGSR